jgi:pimeloyl-ACP methyl ester carboxylesterase
MEARVLDVPGGRLAYDVYGESNRGPWVVCAPSLGDVRGEYRFLAPRLAAAGYRVASMDIRGLGDSSVGWRDYTAGAIGSDMLAVVRALGGGPAFLVGTSISGGAAVWAAAEAPEKVAGLVLIGANVGGDPGPEWKTRLVYGPVFARPWGVAVWLRYFASLYPTVRPDDWDDYVCGLRSNLRERGRLQALRRQMYALAAGGGQVRRRVAGVVAPTLVVMGTKDADFEDPSAEAQNIAGKLSSARAEVRLIEGAGHYPHAEMPARTAPAIVEFLEGVRGGRGLAAHGA